MATQVPAHAATADPVLSMPSPAPTRDCQTTPTALFDVPRTVISVAMQLCSACLYLRNNEILHRDIKSPNILVRQTTAGAINIKLADFDTAVRLSPHAVLTEGNEEQLKGTYTVRRDLAAPPPRAGAVNAAVVCLVVDIGAVDGTRGVFRALLQREEVKCRACPGLCWLCCDAIACMRGIAASGRVCLICQPPPCVRHDGHTQ